MASRDEIIAFCDELLDSPSFDDYGPNGLQVPGSGNVSRIATGVSAHAELIEQALAAGAQMLLVHHGLFWSKAPSALSEGMAGRLRAALGGELSVAGYHLPLDAHPEIGNNALLCDRLSFTLAGIELGVHGGRPVGAVGRSDHAVAAGELFRRVADVTGREPLTFDSGPPEVRSIGIVSGGAAGDLGAAIALGLDAFLTGEPSEPAMAEAREGGIHFIAAGHYATETFGIRALGDRVADRFGVEHDFIDVPNPV
jgi:dinuclear metal center YbgI/SA1388 family protein